MRPPIVIETRFRAPLDVVRRFLTESEFRDGAKVKMRHRIVETLRREGDATVHRVEIRQEPLTPGMRRSAAGEGKGPGAQAPGARGA